MRIRQTDNTSAPIKIQDILLEIDFKMEKNVKNIGISCKYVVYSKAADISTIYRPQQTRYVISSFGSLCTKSGVQWRSQDGSLDVHPPWPFLYAH